MTRALAPVVHAACACSRPGDRVRLTATIIPEDGAVTVVAHDDERVDACVRQALDGRFEPFELGSDCIDCGPKRYPVCGTSPAQRARSRITYPFTLVHP